MTVPDLLPDDDATGAEMRARPRFALMLRSAKLVGPEGEYLCIVRDVSETGVKLRLFHPLAESRNLALEISTGERLPLDPVWQRNGEAGFRFVAPIDVVHFIAEASPYPKRPVRISFSRSAKVTVAGETVEATMVNLSRQGARIESESRLALGQKLRIAADGLPEFDATVCWRRHPAYGIVFAQVMSLEELADRAWRIQTDQAAA